MEGLGSIVPEEYGPFPADPYDDDSYSFTVPETETVAFQAVYPSSPSSAIVLILNRGAGETELSNIGTNSPSLSATLQAGQAYTLYVAYPDEPYDLIITTSTYQYPTAVNDSYSIPDADQSIPATSGVLANDLYQAGDDISVDLEIQASHGYVILNPENGSFTYDPNTNFIGTDTFTYSLIDYTTDFESKAATVTITVGTPSNTILSGETQTVSSGTITSATVVDSGGWNFVLSGASDFGAQVAGVEFVYGYGSGTVVSNGGVLAVFGSASGVTIQSGGYGCVEAGGTATSTTVDGTLGVVGNAVNTTISSGGQLTFGGTTTGTIIKSGGLDYVESDAIERGATVSNGGADVVMSGGFASGTAVSSGGFDYVMSGGTASDTIVNGGGVEYVLAGGSDLGGEVSSGGVDFVYGYVGGTLVSSGGGMALFGSASAVTIASAGYACIEVGGTATGTTVEGTLGVLGKAVSTTISVGGVVNVAGTTTGTIIRNGGVENVEGGGIESAATISNGGVDLVLSAGLASETTVSSGGVDYVTSSGTGSATVVGNGGWEYVLPGGSELGGSVTSGGVDFVYGGAVGIVISSGGALAIFGSASGVTVSRAGYACIEAGGTATGTMVDGVLGVMGSSLNATISFGGDITINGKASATTIDNGGGEYIASGGTESSVTLSGGVLELASGGSVGSVTFANNGAAGGLFQIDSAALFNGLVTGFSSTAPDIAFLGIPYLSGITTYGWSQTTNGGNASGTLTVHEGADSANITLLGNYAAGQFALSAYGGGTLVTDPPVIAATDPNPVVLATTRHA